MRPIFGIILTVFACYGATGNWGSFVQILCIIGLGLGCLTSDLQAMEK